jgi:hypothetical protein
MAIDGVIVLDNTGQVCPPRASTCILIVLGGQSSSLASGPHRQRTLRSTSMLSTTRSPEAALTRCSMSRHLVPRARRLAHAVT